jgi:FKBP-type peptidyl-prolyl cis-trans isomerase SlyD
MTVQKDKVVSFLYTLKDDQGTILDESKEQPLEYLHGYKNIIKGLETALEGLSVGDKKEVKVEPTEGYGLHHDSLIETFEKSQFPEELELEPGIELQVQTPEGPMIFSVKSIDGDKVTLDGNHPLAGETLYFSIEISDIRDAHPEEIAHGHVHGPDGHHH